MLRKILSSLLLILLPSYASAAFYLGAGVGPQMIDFSQESHIYMPGNLNVRDKNTLAANGYFASVFAGYDYYVLGPDLRTKNVYLAGEVNINASNVEHYSSNSELLKLVFSSTKYKMDHSLGLSFLPGFLVTESTLFYGRLGYSKGNFKIFTTDSSLTPTNKNLDGFLYGLGVRQCVWKQIAVSLEYSQANYQGVKIHTNTTNGVVKVVNISPVTAQVEFAMLYYFS